MALDDIRYLLPPATRYINRRLCDTLPIPGMSDRDWRGLEIKTYYVGSTAYHTEGKEPPPCHLQPQLSLFQHWRTHILADGPH